jgi:tetratricopeptide (TPR) repeat protein
MNPVTWLFRTIPCIAAALLLAAALPPRGAQAQQENLLERISNERMIQFEQALEQNLNRELRRFLAAGQYVLSVRVIWDRTVIPPTEAPGLSPDKQKLPGFPIFVRSPDAPTDDKIPPFTRLVVKILLDETLPEYYERFLRKIVPIVARFVAERGDQLIVLKETFPDLKREQIPPPLSEQDLMGQLPEPATTSAAIADQMSPAQEARVAYDEGRYEEALRVVRRGFQSARNNDERGLYMAMEGSIQYTMNNRDQARAAWQRALTYNPADPEVRRVLDFIQSRESGNPGR